MGVPATDASADTLFDMVEVAKHATARDCWLVISGGVYDVTGYLSDHPGGEDVMLDMAGKDATNEFDDVGHSADAVEQLRHLRIGSVLATAASAGPAAATAAGGGATATPGGLTASALTGAAAPAAANPAAAAAAAAAATGKDDAAAAAAAAGAAAGGGDAAGGAAAKGGAAPSRTGDAVRALAATLAAVAAVTAVMAARRYVASLYWQRKA